MAVSFLEEQLERIRKLTEHMSEVQARSAELSQELARDRQSAARQDPLHEVRDYRIIGHSNDTRPLPRSTASAGPPRRRRRR